MKPRRRKMATVGILVLGLLLAAGVLEARVQEATQTSVKPTPAAAPGQETSAAPRPVKERMAVYVLLAWVWFSIAVLLWLLRMRVREADRVHRMGLSRAAGKAPKGPGH
jgi:hypothetical protein